MYEFSFDKIFYVNEVAQNFCWNSSLYEYFLRSLYIRPMNIECVNPVSKNYIWEANIAHILDFVWSIINRTKWKLRTQAREVITIFVHNFYEYIICNTYYTKNVEVSLTPLRGPTIIAILLKFETAWKIYIKATKYLLRLYTSQRSQEYSKQLSIIYVNAISTLNESIICIYYTPKLAIRTVY